MFVDYFEVETHFEFVLSQTFNAFPVVDDCHILHLLSLQSSPIVDCHFVIGIEFKHIHLVFFVLVESQRVSALLSKQLHEIFVCALGNIRQLWVKAIIARQVYVQLKLFAQLDQFLQSSGPLSLNFCHVE